MAEQLGLWEALHVFMLVMLSFAFFVGILLVVSQDAFDNFNKELQKEYGIKKRFFPKIEDSWYDFIDYLMLKNRLITGLAIAITAFLLLLFFR